LIHGSPDLIVKAVDIMSTFYTENPLKRSDNPYTGSPSSNTEADIARTRQFFNINTPRSDQGANGSVDHEVQSPVNGANGIHENSSHSKEKQSHSEPGYSDLNLKEAANDPATHENTAVTNGTDKAEALSQGSKRKSPEVSIDEPARKVAKLSDDSGAASTDSSTAKLAERSSTRPMADSGSEGEEGELEE